MIDHVEFDSVYHEHLCYYSATSFRNLFAPHGLTLVDAEQLAAYRHEGFWQCMDTLRDKRLLESLWQTGRQVPWKVWEA